MTVIGVTGLHVDPLGNTRIAGAGKDQVANRLLQKHGFVLMSFADPLKRFLQDVYEFTDEQLWGESEKRTEPDTRYPRPPQHQLAAYLQQGLPTQYLTPRLALTSLGNDWGRECYDATWVDYLKRTAKKLMAGGYTYSQQRGLQPCIYANDDPWIRPKIKVVVTDCRYFNEALAIREAGGLLVRVKRLAKEPFNPAQMNGKHASEVELPQWGDDMFDYIVDNNGTLNDLAMRTDSMHDAATGRMIPYDESQADIPPFLRKPTTT